MSASTAATSALFCADRRFVDRVGGDGVVERRRAPSRAIGQRLPLVLVRVGDGLDLILLRVGQAESRGPSIGSMPIGPPGPPRVRPRPGPVPRNGGGC